MYDDTENKEIEELIRKIKMYAFKGEHFLLFEDGDKESKKEEIEVCTKIYSLNSLNRKYPIIFKWRNNIKNLRVNGNSKFICVDSKDYNIIWEHHLKINNFIWDLAEIMFEHKKNIKPESGKKLMVKVKKSMISEIRHLLIKKQYFSKGAINKAAIFLKRDLDKQFRRPKFVDYFVAKYPGSRIRQEEEDSVIDRIYRLYQKEFSNELNHLKIISNMAFVFVATEFWTENREDSKKVHRCRERLKKRFKKIEELSKAF